MPSCGLVPGMYICVRVRAWCNDRKSCLFLFLRFLSCLLNTGVTGTLRSYRLILLILLLILISINNMNRLFCSDDVDILHTVLNDGIVWQLVCGGARPRNLV